MGRSKRSPEQIKFDIQEQQKTCCVCNERKSFAEFYNYANKSDGKSYRCKTCDDLASKKWKFHNAEQARKSMRGRMLKYRFNITLKDYHSLLVAQDYKCAICKADSPGNMSPHKDSFSVDHCHSTGKIRGLLCNQCNRGLGMLGDTVESLEKALNYLKGDTH